METLPIAHSKTREQLFTDLYLEAFPAIARYISKTGGDLEEAKDVFQEALVVYYEKVILQHHQITISEKAYLLGICKNIWLKRRSNVLKAQSLQDEALKEVAGKTLIKDKLLRFLQQTGEKCLALLQAFYYEKASMKELAERFEFRNERSATVQKYKCLTKVRTQIQKHALTYEDFMD
ncbi:MAG: RNA polymerase sigma factor [Flammeovirgaceae bacterium]